VKKFLLSLLKLIRLPESLPDPSSMTEAEKLDEIEELERRIDELKPPRPKNNRANYIDRMTQIHPRPKDVH